VGITEASSLDLKRVAYSPVSLFLMTNTFETGGSERQFAILAQNLNPTRFQLHFGCVSRRGAFAADFPTVPEFRLGGSLYGWQSLRTRLHLARMLRRNRVQIAHAFEFYTTLTMVPAARLARVPVVIGSFRQLGDLLTPAQFRVQTAAFRWCDVVVCNSHAGAARLAAAGLPRKKLLVIGNAMPQEMFAEAVPALPARRDVLRVGMVARMNARYKNHSGFLRIAALVREQVPNVEFLLAGDGPLRAELEEEARSLGLGESVTFIGDRRDVPQVLASMDIAVLTSDSEGLSNVILEAMAGSRPVVAYDVGGNRELVNEKRGALIAPGDEEGFAVAVVKLLQDSEYRRQCGASARLFVEQNFSLATVLQQYEELYRSLLERKSSRSATA